MANERNLNGISVIVPVYNAERYVTRAVNSALSQPEVTEVLLIEDGSSDDSLRMCRELSLLYPGRVRLFQHTDNRNLGAGASRNRGLCEARCDWVAFLDADDFYLPDRFSESKISVSNEAADAVAEITRTEFESENVREKFLHAKAQHLIEANGELLTMIRSDVNVDVLFSEFIRGKAGFCHLDSLLVRKSICLRIGGFDEDLRLHQDLHFLIRLTACARFQINPSKRPVSTRWVHSQNRITSAGRGYANQYRVLLWEKLLAWGFCNNVSRRHRWMIAKRWLQIQASGPDGSGQHSSRILRMWRAGTRTLQAFLSHPIRFTRIAAMLFFRAQNEKVGAPEVVFAPNYHRFNPYQRFLSGQLKAQGIEVRMENFKTRLPIINLAKHTRRKIDVLHIHWLDKAYADQRILHHFIKILRTGFEILLLRLLRYRLFYTGHNLHGHDARFPRLERWVHALMVRLGEATFVHSKAAQKRLIATYRLSPSIADKIITLHHGHYFDLFNAGGPAPIQETARANLGIPIDSLVFLVFGHVRAYKGLTSLLEEFRRWPEPNARLVIAGHALKSEDKIELGRQAALDGRVVLMLKHWPDDELPQLFACADACIIPHDWQLTSGSLILCMGFGKPLLLPMRDVTDEWPPLDGNPIAKNGWHEAFSQLGRMSESDRKALGQLNHARASSLSWSYSAFMMAKSYIKY